MPHLLLRSVTSSLLYRLTEDNNDLRDKIGKEVLEAYLLKIMKGSNVYDEVYGEKTFIKEHNTEAKTLDVMVRDADEYIMLDSKASVPSIGLRVYDEESHRKELDKMVEKVVQIYKHLKIFLPNYPLYNPYAGAPTIAESHLWGISVILEDNYIRRDLIYEKAALILKIDKDSDTYKWLVNHIKIASLYEIERYALNGRSLVEELKKQIKKGEPYNFSFLGYDSKNNGGCMNKDYRCFTDDIKKDFIDTTKVLVENGVIQ